METNGKCPFEEVVPGEVVVLSAGDSVPAACRILNSKDLHVDMVTFDSLRSRAEEVGLHFEIRLGGKRCYFASFKA